MTWARPGRLGIRTSVNNIGEAAVSPWSSHTNEESPRPAWSGAFFVCSFLRSVGGSRVERLDAWAFFVRSFLRRGGSLRGRGPLLPVL